MNLLLTSAGRRTYMVEYFKNALKGKGFVHASNSVLTYTLTQADKYVISPSIYGEDYIDFLLDYCTEHNISVIISLFDIDLPVLAKNKEKFENRGIKVIVSDEKVTAICNDKWRTYNFLLSINLLHPKTYISLESFKKSYQRSEVDFPVIVKPRWGMGSIGIFKAANMNELTIFYKKVEQEIFDSYLKYESQDYKNECVLIQETIKGTEYGLDILNDLNGNYTSTIAKQKLAMRAGETDIAEIVDNGVFLSTAKKISQSLKHVANLDVDCFITENNEIIVLELNCRFGGQYPFSHIAGANFPLQIIEWIENKPTNQDFITANVGVLGCKELIPIVLDTNIK